MKIANVRKASSYERDVLMRSFCLQQSAPTCVWLTAVLQCFQIARQRFHGPLMIRFLDRSLRSNQWAA